MTDNLKYTVLSPGQSISCSGLIWGDLMRANILIMEQTDSSNSSMSKYSLTGALHMGKQTSKCMHILRKLHPAVYISYRDIEQEHIFTLTLVFELGLSTPGDVGDGSVDATVSSLSVSLVAVVLLPFLRRIVQPSTDVKSMFHSLQGKIGYQKAIFCGYGNLQRCIRVLAVSRWWKRRDCCEDRGLHAWWIITSCHIQILLLVNNSSHAIRINSWMIYALLLRVVGWDQTGHIWSCSIVFDVIFSCRVVYSHSPWGHGLYRKDVPQETFCGQVKNRIPRLSLKSERKLRCSLQKWCKDSQRNMTICGQE